MLVIHGNILAAYRPVQSGKAFLVTEAVIGVSLLHELLRIFQVNAGSVPLALHVGPAAAVLIGAFVMYQACLCQGTVNNIHGAFHITCLVCILDTKHENAALVFGNKIGVQGSS